MLYIQKLQVDLERPRSQSGEQTRIGGNYVIYYLKYVKHLLD